MPAVMEAVSLRIGFRLPACPLSGARRDDFNFQIEGAKPLRLAGTSMTALGGKLSRTVIYELKYSSPNWMAKFFVFVNENNDILLR